MRGDDDEPTGVGPACGTTAPRLRPGGSRGERSVRRRARPPDRGRAARSRPVAAGRPTCRPGRWSRPLRRSTGTSTAIGTLVRALAFFSIPAARNGSSTFSSAARLGTRLNAWNTTPTVWRRNCVSVAPRAHHLDIDDPTLPHVGDSTDAMPTGASSCRSRSHRAAARARRRRLRGRGSRSGRADIQAASSAYSMVQHADQEACIPRAISRKPGRGRRRRHAASRPGSTRRPRARR